MISNSDVFLYIFTLVKRQPEGAVVGYLQPVCSAVCTVILIFHTVKTFIYYAANKILLNKIISAWFYSDWDNSVGFRCVCSMVRSVRNGELGETGRFWLEYLDCIWLVLSLNKSNRMTTTGTSLHKPHACANQQNYA